MYFNQILIKNLIKHVVVLSLPLLLSMKVYSNETSNLPKLTLKPSQCVSLHQGQQCFVTVDISWQVSNAGEYCLYSSLQNNKLSCWTMKKSGHFKQELVIEEDVTFTLRLMGDGISNDKVVVSALLESAWVYKKNRLSHSAWRVF
jgi:hypothetical protein